MYYSPYMIDLSPRGWGKQISPEEKIKLAESISQVAQGVLGLNHVETHLLFGKDMPNRRSHGLADEVQHEVVDKTDTVISVPLATAWVRATLEIKQLGGGKLAQDHEAVKGAMIRATATLAAGSIQEKLRERNPQKEDSLIGIMDQILVIFNSPKS